MTASPAWRVCAGSQSHPHPHAASPSGRAQHPPRPVVLSPLKPSLLSSRPGLQAWPLRTPSQASDNRPGAPCPAPPVLTSHHPGEGRHGGRPGSGVHRWAPRLGDHVCHVLLFPPFLSEQQGVLRPTPCRPGIGHAGLAAPRRPGGLLGKTGEPCRAATLSRGSCPRRLRMTIKTRLLSPGTPAVADIPSGGRSSPTAWMSQLRQHQGSSAPLLDPPPTSSGVWQVCMLSLWSPASWFKSRAAHLRHVSLSREHRAHSTIRAHGLARPQSTQDAWRPVGHGNSRDTGWTYVGHHGALEAAAGRLGGCWVPARGWRLQPTLRTTGRSPVLPGSMGQDGGYAELHLEVQEVIPGVLKKQVLQRQGTRDARSLSPAGGT